MENFFNYITKPLPPEDVEIWFKINNIIPEKMELFSDFCQSLNLLIFETYLGEIGESNETKVVLTEDDNIKHFEWCLNKTIENFGKEGIFFKNKGDHIKYFKTFYKDIFYNQKDKKIKSSINIFFKDLFDIDKPYSKSDLDVLQLIYKNLDKNMSI